MNVWYNSESRFKKRIIKSWNENGFKYHNGHINILKYAFRTLSYWSSVKNEKISDKNKVETYPTLF